MTGARYVHESASASRLNLAQGLFGASVLLGAGFVILAVPRLEHVFGWRVTFLISACLAVAALLVWWAAAPSVRSSLAPKGRFSGMVLSPQLWLLGLMQMATFGLSMVVGTWIIALLVKALDVPAVQAGLVGSLVLLVGIVSRPLGGVMRLRFGLRWLLVIGLTMNAVGCIALALNSTSLPLALVAVVVVGCGCGLPYAAMFSRAGALFPGRAGAAMGLVNMLGIVMILVGAPAVGKLADWSGNFRSSFVALAVVAVVACVAVLFVQSEEPSPAPSH